MSSRVLIPFRSKNHQHRRCQKTALLQAEQICRDRGVRLTPIRKRVLDQIWRSHAPAKAYDILESMHRPGHRLAPPTVYRALDFLMETGLIHKLDSHNAFVGCGAPDQTHRAQFLICRHCGNVAELNNTAVSDALKDQAGSLGFTVENESIELQGLCDDCVTAEA